MSRDGITGLVVLATSLVFFALTLELKDSPLVPIGPGFYPRIILGVTAALAAILVVTDWFSKRERSAAERFNYGLVTVMFATFGLYVGALPYLGFRIATLIYVAAANAILAPPRGAKAWIRITLVAVVTTVLTYYVFEHYLTVLLPRGRWTDF